MLTCYLDEAGGGSQDGFTVVCGWVSTVALWEQFEIDWKLLLASKTYNVPYFHMKEFSQSTGPFKKWKGNETKRRLFLADASRIIRDCVRPGAGVICNVVHRLFETANRRYMVRESLSSPYATAGRVCVAQVDLWCKRDDNISRDVKFVFEDGGPDKSGLLNAMNVSYKYPDPIFEPSRDIKDKRGNARKGIVQLQAADLLAYEIRKLRREFIGKTGRPPRQSLRAILGVPNILKNSFNELNAVSLCQLEALPERIMTVP